MKTLKLDHELALLVEQGAKTSTWRLYDDKDLTVNDDVQLIDKVNPGNPETWRPIGIAHIDSVIQKRLGDLSAEDYDGHEQFSSKQNMLETYRNYYGPQVDEQTPIKIIRFTFNNSNDMPATSDVKNASKITEVKLYADGGSRGNPGPSASGFALMDMQGRIVVKKSVYLGITTNNQAEYQALKLGLEEARRTGAHQVHVYMDSLLVVNQMLGIFKVKNRDLWPIHEAIKDMLPSFRHVSFTHVPRELNKVADAAVNEALDEAEGHA
ncbi:MAG TPA: reverse transcriptase-like protein [Patescibacteria group bacterium]|nr:reverse transcriptase-like protein [Patescibacteria group bacterium]